MLRTFRPTTTGCGLYTSKHGINIALNRYEAQTITLKNIFYLPLYKHHHDVVDYDYEENHINKIGM